MFKITLPGMGPKLPDPEPAPPPPAAPPRQAQASAATDKRGRKGLSSQGVAGGVRNVGGAMGLSLSETLRSLKSLTGQ